MEKSNQKLVNQKSCKNTKTFSYYEFTLVVPLFLICTSIFTQIIHRIFYKNFDSSMYFHAQCTLIEKNQDIKAFQTVTG